MTAELVQDAIVTVVMLAAVATVARRVFGFVGARDSIAGRPSAGCDKCAAGPSHQGSAAVARPGTRPAGGTVTVHPVRLIRPSTSSRTTSA